MTQFLLTTEPWLPVVTAQGTDTIGLIEAFERADDIMIAPRGPLEERAVQRLLLAISYAALGAPTAPEYPRPFNGHAVAEWLTTNTDAFDLLNPTAPFGQDAALAGDLPYAHIVPIANADSTVARSRPLITDHRRATDIPAVPLAEAVITMLVYNAFDAPGIHEGVKAFGSVTDRRPNGSNAPLKGTEGSTFAFVLKGTLAASMSWAMIPVEHLGTPTWTYSGPGGVEATPDGELESLTWLFRRLLLHHDGTHATGIQVHQGRVRKTPTTKTNPDTLPGQHNYVLSANDPKVTAATGEIGAPTSAGRGNPLHLVERWEAGSDTSLSGYVRAALNTNPDLTAPTVVAIGQRLENTALKVLVREGHVPRVNGGLAARATHLIETRRHKRLFPSDDLLTVHLLDETDETEIDEQLNALRITPTDPQPQWPTNAKRLSAAARNEPEPLTDPDGIDADILRDLAAVVELEDRTAAPTGPAGTLRRIRHLLRTNPDTTEQIARATQTRIPTDTDLTPLQLPDLTPAQHLWAGLLAVAINDWKFPWDGTKPLPTALRQAGARLHFPQAQDALNAATNAPDLIALRAPLLRALALTARSETTFAWWSLADDLENWTTTTRKAWTHAFNTRTTATTDTKQEEN